jgi:PAS domain S-box-containing protein
VGSELEFAPYSFVDQDGQPAGFGVDLIRAVAGAMGLPIEISTGTWDTVWNRLAAGQLEILPIVAKLPERLQSVDFSLPHTETYDAFFVRRGAPPIRSLAGAAGKEIVVMRSDAAHHALAERKFPGRMILADTIPDALKLVASGRHDAFLGSKRIGSLALRKHDVKGLVAGPVIADYKRVFSFGVKKGEAELLEKLNQGLLIIKANGDYQQIYDRWLDEELPWEHWKHYWRPAALGLLAALLVVAAWLVAMQRLVRNRTRQLAEKNAALSRIQAGLEQAVAGRTAELQTTNAQLRMEIAERQAAEAKLSRQAAFTRSIFDSTGASMAVVDATGKIVEVNAIWRQFGRENGAPVDAAWGVGGQYFQPVSGPEPDPSSAAAYAGIRQVQRGLLPTFQMDYRCHLPGEHRWFAMQVTPMAGEPGTVLVSHREVTEQKRAEEALRVKDRAVESSINGIAMADLEGRLTYVNEAFLRMWGYARREEVLGRSVLDFWIAPEQAGTVLSALLAKGGWEGELSGRRQDGAHFEVQLSGSQVVDDWQQPLCVLGSFIDITIRKQAEQALRTSEERLHQAQAAAKSGSWEWNLLTNENHWSDEIWPLYGLEQGAVQPSYDSWLQTVHPEDRPRTTETLRKAVEQGADLNLEWRVAGTERWLLSRGQPVRGAGGRVERYLGVVMDITDRKRSEEARRESEERFQTAFRHAPIGMALVAPDGRWLKVNPAAGRLLGYSEKELLAVTFQELTHPDDLRADLDLVRQVLAGELETYQMEKRYFHRSGAVVWALLSVSLVRDERGQPRHFISQIQDITERKRVEESLRSSLEEKVSLLKEVHHRVKNNLQIVNSLLSLQSRRLQNREAVEALQDTRNRVSSMALLHEALYRSENLARINFPAYVEQLCNTLLRSFGPAAARVQVERRIARIGLPLDQSMPCGLIITELVSNALKHAFPGGRAGRVVVELDSGADHRLVLRVSDDGAGLPPDFKLERAASLGMRLVTDLAGQLDGQWTLASPGSGAPATESGPGQPGGTVFQVVFPPPKGTEMEPKP